MCFSVRRGENIHWHFYVVPFLSLSLSLSLSVGGGEKEREVGVYRRENDHHHSCFSLSPSIQHREIQEWEIRSKRVVRMRGGERGKGCKYFRRKRMIKLLFSCFAKKSHLLFI